MASKAMEKVEYAWESVKKRPFKSNGDKMPEEKRYDLSKVMKPGASTHETNPTLHNTTVIFRSGTCQHSTRGNVAMQVFTMNGR